MLCRDEDEVRQKAKELGLVEGIVDQAMAAKVRPAVLGQQTQARTISCIAPLYNFVHCPLVLPRMWTAHSRQTRIVSDGSLQPSLESRPVRRLHR
jgi:hypothetical protein